MEFCQGGRIFMEEKQSQQTTKKQKLILGEKWLLKSEIAKYKAKAEARGKGPVSTYAMERLKRRVHRKAKRNFIIGMALATIGIGGTAVGAHYFLNAPKQENRQEEASKEEKKNAVRDFKLQYVKPETLLKGIEEQNQIDENEIEENTIFEQIVEKFNSEYPESQISESDLGIIETHPQFLIKQTNENGEIEYLQNYNINAQNLEDNQKVAYNTNYTKGADSINIGEVYTVVNKKDHTIILSQGMVDSSIVDVDVKQIKIGNQDYVEGKKITLGDSEAEKVITYKDLQSKLKEIVKDRQKQGDELEQ